MPSDVRLPTALSGLGDPLQVYPPKATAGRTGNFAVAAILLLLSAAPVIGLLNPPQNNPPPQAVFLAVMGLFLVLSVVFFSKGVLSQNQTLILYREALARSGGSDAEIFRWSDIRDVYTYVSPVAAMHRLVTADGRKLQIDGSVKDGKQLGNNVRQAIFEHMLPGARQAFERGETLSFGPLRIDQGFLYYKDKRLAWYEVAKMQLLYNNYTRSIQLEVTGGGAALPWCSVKVQDIPNVDVFKALAEQKRAFTA